MDRTAAEVGVGVALDAGRGRFRFHLAGPADDADLRRLLRETPMDGPVRITLRREPSFFQAAAVEGPNYQTLVVRDTSNDRLVGMGTRSIRLRYVRGQPTPVGYLGGLRLLPEVRSGLLLARGYRALHQLHQDKAADFYLTTIAEGNRRAIEALTPGRCDMPAYREIGRYLTMILPWSRCRPEATPAGCDVAPLCREELPQLVEFLQRVGKQRMFFPCYQAEDFVGPRTTFPNLPLERILAAKRGGDICGVIGVWDQTPFRQMVVEGYSRKMRLVRPAFNAWAAWRGWPRFPSPGKPFRPVVAALPVVESDDARILEALLAAAARHESARDSDGLMIGASETDPLSRLLRRRALFTYATRVYLVSWEKEPIDPPPLDSPSLYLELGCL